MSGRFLILLGASNDAEGVLTPLASTRADLALHLYQASPHVRILCTGGHGRFNPASRPHAWYVAEYLLRGGLPESALLDPVLSTNTVEDALLARERLSAYDPGSLSIVTSDFHVARSRFIFSQVFEHLPLTYYGAPVQLSEEERARRLRHEARGLERLRLQGRILTPEEWAAENAGAH